MLTCKDISEKISSWIDHQLEFQEYEDVSRHIENCPACHAKVLLEQQTRNLLKTKLPVVNIPAGLRDKILKQITAESVPKSFLQKIKDFLSTPITHPVPITAVVACLIVGYFSYMTWFYQPPVTDIAQWWVCKSAVHSYDMDKDGKYTMNFTDSDPKTLIQKVNASHQRNFAMALPNFNSQSFQIAGCRFSELAEKPSIYLSLKHDGHLVSLQMISAADVKFPKAVAKQVNGQSYFVGTYYNSKVLIWEKNNLIYTVTSDLPEKEMTELITPQMISMPEKSSARTCS